MIESKIINGHPWSIGCGDPDPSKRGEDAALMSDLSEDVQRQVSDWIFGKLCKRDTHNYDHDSYELKHRIERELGIYLTNNQMKDAMLQEGFRPVISKLIRMMWQIVWRKLWRIGLQRIRRWLYARPGIMNIR